MKYEINGWAVEADAPRIAILDEAGKVRLESSDWTPPMLASTDDQIASDALGWAAAMVDTSYGAFSDEPADSDFGRMLADVQANAPQGFADECSMLSQDLEVA